MSRRLSDVELERSSVVANSRMNRSRVLTGGNGYVKELGFHPLEWLRQHGHTRWLDLCCGEGRALAEAGTLAPDVRIVGVDLAGLFVTPPPNVTLIEASLRTWNPAETFGLITCVHGLHYVGDKLGLMARAAAWLGKGGLLVANVDLRNVRGVSRATLERTGLRYARRRLSASRSLRAPPWSYLGADDRAGSNYTGQPAVTSFYRLGSERAEPFTPTPGPREAG